MSSTVQAKANDGSSSGTAAAFAWLAAGAGITIPPVVTMMTGRPVLSHTGANNGVASAGSTGAVTGDTPTPSPTTPGWELIVIGGVVFMTCLCCCCALSLVGVAVVIVLRYPTERDKPSAERHVPQTQGVGPRSRVAVHYNDQETSVLGSPALVSVALNDLNEDGPGGTVSTRTTHPPDSGESVVRAGDRPHGGGGEGEGRGTREQVPMAELQAEIGELETGMVEAEAVFTRFLGGLRDGVASNRDKEVLTAEAVTPCHDMSEDHTRSRSQSISVAHSSQSQTNDEGYRSISQAAQRGMELPQSPLGVFVDLPDTLDTTQLARGFVDDVIDDVVV